MKLVLKEPIFVFGENRKELLGVDKLEVDDNKAYLWFYGQSEYVEIQRDNIAELKA